MCWDARSGAAGAVAVGELRRVRRRPRMEREVVRESIVLAVDGFVGRKRRNWI